MRHTKSPLSPGMTAIAAVLALSSTPLLAQAAAPAPTETAPPLVTPPPVVVPPPATAAPAPAAQTTARPAPVVAAPAPMASAPAPSRMVSAPAPAADHVVPSRPAPRAAPAAAKTATPKPAAPRVVEATPVPATPVAPPPAPIAAKPVVAPAPAPAPQTADTTDETLPIAGAAGAAILVLAGGAYALMRRGRREDEDVVYLSDEVTTPIEAAPVASEAMIREETHYVQPVGYVEPKLPFAEPVATAPRRGPEGFSADADGPIPGLPAGFDISRFGRHAQAAYRGPTPDNPSVSLKRRLKVASFYDQRERMAAQAATEGTASAHPAAAAQPATGQRQSDHVTTKVNRPPRPGFRPAYSS